MWTGVLWYHPVCVICSNKCSLWGISELSPEHVEFWQQMLKLQLEQRCAMVGRTKVPRCHFWAGTTSIFKSPFAKPLSLYNCSDKKAAQKGYGSVRRSGADGKLEPKFHGKHGTGEGLAPKASCASGLLGTKVLRCQLQILHQQRIGTEVPGCHFSQGRFGSTYLWSLYLFPGGSV